MTPALLFSLTLLITAAALAAEAILRRRHQRRLREIARRWRMNYSPSDQFRLTPRVARSFPVPGAARIRVTDLIYGLEADIYRFVLTAEYTTGILTGKRRTLRAATLCESRDRGGQGAGSPIILAPAHLSLIEQYHQLKPPCAQEDSQKSVAAATKP